MADFEVPMWDMDEKTEAVVDKIFGNMAILSTKKDKLSAVGSAGAKTKSKKRKRKKMITAAKLNNTVETTECDGVKAKSEKRKRKKAKASAKPNDSVASQSVCTAANALAISDAGSTGENVTKGSAISQKKKKRKKPNSKKNKYAHLGRKSDMEKLSFIDPSVVENFSSGAEIEVGAMGDETKRMTKGDKSEKSNKHKLFPVKSGTNIMDKSAKSSGKKRKFCDTDTKEESLSKFRCSEIDNESRTVKKRKFFNQNETSPKDTKNNLVHGFGSKTKQISVGSNKVQNDTCAELSSVKKQQASNGGNRLQNSAKKKGSVKKIKTSQCKDDIQKPEKKKKLKKKNSIKLNSDIVCEEKSFSEETSSRKKGCPQKLPFNIDKLRAALAAARSPSGPTEAGKSRSIDTDTADISDAMKKKGKTKSSEEKDAEPSLRESMMARLSAARFRLINEELYTSVSKDAVELFKTDQEAFKIYHEGYQCQVAKWPTVPVDKMVQYIKNQSSGLVVADFGCGDAKIAQSVPNKVYSFDLVALNKHVTVCDMKHVPLGKASVDIAVFCLSLMGTNLVEFLCEANRVLKSGGILLIAEVISRFRKITVFVKKLQKLGFTVVQRDQSNTMFVWFEFKKVGQPPSAGKLPSIELDPCIYKKR